MYQEEILKAIKEQTEAIKLQNELLESLVRSVEALNSGLNVGAIATAVVRKLRIAEEMKLDIEFNALDLVAMKEKNKLEVGRPQNEI